MSVLEKKIDFAVVIRVKNANPNGDPIDGNRPRRTLEGLGEISDVALKRKIRNRAIDEGEKIYVQQDDRRAPGDNFRSLKDRADGNEALKKWTEANKKGGSREEYAKIACQEWFDVRAFGQVFAFKKKGEDSEGVSIGIRGPVSIQSAYSLEPVNVTSLQITKSVNLETGADPDKKGKDTMGMKHRVDQGIYVTYGAINVQTAEKTGFSDKDAELLKELLRTLFRNDETSARPAGSMEVVKVIWWKHANKVGQYSSARVHRSLKVHQDENGEAIISVDSSQIPDLEYEVCDGE